jgi:Spy/CpxP family protein refolding chaperone
MRRISLLAAATLLTLGAALPSASAFAQAERQAIRPSRHRLVRCLSILDLTEEQKAKIDGFVEAAKPGLEADAAAVRAAYDTLEASLQAQPPDSCQIGTDALALQSARQTLIAARQALREQITSVLTPDQQSRFDVCIDLFWPSGADSGSNDLLHD